MRRALPLVVPALVVAAALWARLGPWGQVFGEREPQLVGDTDAQYHLLRAERWLAGAPGAPWIDPALDWPHGADVPWPPLFDGILVALARVVEGPVVERGALVALAALVPPALGLLFLVLVAVLGGRIFGRRQGWIAALVVALSAAGADPARLGRVDQHVLETVLFTALLVALVPATGRRPRPLAAGAVTAVVVTLAFWSWMGTPMHLLVALACLSALHLLRRDPGGAHPGDHGAAVLAVAGLGGAALLAVTVALFGRPGAIASSATTGVGGLQVALTAAAGSFAALLLAARRRAPDAPRARRVLELAVAAALPGLVLLALPSVRQGIAGGLTALTAGNPWYETIDEFQPLVGNPGDPASLQLLVILRGYGLTWLAVPLAGLALRRRWREDPARRPALVTLAVVFLTLVPAALLRKRFNVYAVIPFALATELGLRHGAAWLVGRLRPGAPAWAPGALAACLAVVALLPCLPEHGALDPSLPPDKRELLRFVSHQRSTPGRECVLAPWALGHAIQYFAGRPVVASPFGTEGGAGAMPALAATWFAEDEARAEALLAERRCGFLLLGIVPAETWTLHGFAPAGTPPPFEVSPARGEMAETLAYWRLLPVRLYHEDGLPSRDLAALGAFRLLVETPLTSPENPALEDNWKLYEQVAGARLVVRAAEGTDVVASVQLRTNAGRRLEWFTTGRIGADGAATLRLPYASGQNGLTRAGPWTVTAGERRAELVVHEAAVVDGLVVEVDPARAVAAR